LQKVFFHYADKTLSIIRKKELKENILTLFKLEKQQLERLDYVFCSDEYLLKINLQFLNHDYYTDIITFDLSENTCVKGEIYISVDRIAENATLNNVSFKEELARVIFHGALHLCGYKDKKKTEIKLMREKEEYYLQLFHMKQS
jgi:rRNA maturation RNase YbeY